MQNFSFRMEEAAMDKEERLKQQIETYQPFNLQEEQDRAEILRQFETAEHIMSRENRNAHVTVSALSLIHISVVLGKAGQRQKEIYETVRKAQAAALLVIRAGIRGKEADRAAREVIGEAGYSAFFGHSLGHSLGLFIHEQPSLSPVSEKILLPGMVETVEPGIYVPGFGGVRIEDLVLVTETGCENLTSSPKEMIEL